MKLPTLSEIDFKAIETPLLAQLVRKATKELNNRLKQGNHLLVDVFTNGHAERQVRTHCERVSVPYHLIYIDELHDWIKLGGFKPGRMAMNYINNEIFEPNGFERIDINYKRK